MTIGKLDTIVTYLNCIRISELKTLFVKIFKVSFCLFIFYGVSVSQANDNSENRYATFEGVVADYNGAVIPDANIIIEGTSKYEVMTTDDGSYSIKLPSGIYRFRVESPKMGFCPAVRSAVYLENKARARIDFTLFGCYSVYLNQSIPEGVKELEHPLIGEFTFEKISPQYLKESKIKEIGIRYGEKKQAKGTTIYTADVVFDINEANGVDYPGVLLTYNLSTIQAKKITIKSKSRIIAEGNVIVKEKGKKTEGFNIIQVRIVNGLFVVKSIKNK